MSKRKCLLILTVATFVVMLFTATAFAGVKYVYFEQDYGFAKVGQSFTIKAVLADEDFNDVEDSSGRYTVEWYRTTPGEYDYNNLKKLGTGLTYTIPSVTNNDFADEDNGENVYVARLMDNGKELDYMMFEIYDAANIDTSVDDVAVRLGVKLVLKPEVYHPEVDGFHLQRSGFTFKWYKKSGSSWTNVGTSENLTFDKVSSSNLGTYRVDTYLNGTKLLTGDEFTITEKTRQAVDSAEVCGKQYIEDGTIVGTLPAGITYDKSTGTFTLNNYEGTIDTKLLDVSGDVNIKLIGDNTIHYTGKNYMTGIIDCGGDTTIYGTGSLTIDVAKGCGSTIAIGLGQDNTIKDCKININGNGPDGFFYGISLSPWANYYDGCGYAGLTIDSATINIKNSFSKGCENANVGIDVQDADLSITNSNINIDLKNGSIYGIGCGLYQGGGVRYGGELNVDNSTVVIDTGDADPEESSSIYFYSGNLDSANICAGSSKATSKMIAFDDFEREYYGQYWTLVPYFEITPHKWSSVIDSPATLSADGKGTRVCSHCTESYDIVIPAVKSITVTTTKGTYTGKNQTPEYKVTDTSGATVPAACVKNGDFTSVGKHTITVKNSSSDYSFSKTFTYQIDPKGTSISKLKSASKAFTVYWKKQSAQTTGYQIQYSLKSNMSGAKTVTVAKNTATSKKISKLKAKKKYYVRIRTYKTVSGKKYYSAWSAKKSVKTK